MPLTIAIPVSHAGLNRLSASVDSMEFLGGLQKHMVVFCCAPSVHAAVAEQAARLRAICPNVFVDPLPREPEGAGKFGAFNAIFRDSVELLYLRKNENPWIWWEEDMTAIKGGWADRLELEYHQKGQRFMGVRRAAREVMRGLNGQALDERDPRAQGDYMVAVGIYPPNFKDYSTLYKYPDPTGNMPTDVNIRFEINRNLHHTNLIAHHWNTGNYRRNEQGQIVCDDINRKDGEPSYGGVVSEMAYVVHGCKDGTLSRLILSELPGNVSAMPQQAVSHQAPNPAIAVIQAENEEMRRDIAKLQEQWRVKENGYAEEIEALKEGLDGEKIALRVEARLASAPAVAGIDPAFEAAKEPAKPAPTLPAIRQHLADAGKAIQLSVLAADFGINRTLLRNILATDPGIKIGKGGLAWVSLAA